MKNALVYNADDIKEILAMRHGVPERNVIRNQYSYTVVLNDDEASDTGKEDEAE